MSPQAPLPLLSLSPGPGRRLGKGPAAVWTPAQAPVGGLRVTGTRLPKCGPPSHPAPAWSREWGIRHPPARVPQGVRAGRGSGPDPLALWGGIRGPEALGRLLERRGTQAGHGSRPCPNCTRLRVPGKAEPWSLSVGVQSTMGTGHVQRAVWAQGKGSEGPSSSPLLENPRPLPQSGGSQS